MKNQAQYDGYNIVVKDNGDVTITCHGEACKSVLHSIAKKMGFAYENSWDTKVLGQRMVTYINANSGIHSATLTIWGYEGDFVFLDRKGEEISCPFSGLEIEDELIYYLDEEEIEDELDVSVNIEKDEIVNVGYNVDALQKHTNNAGYSCEIEFEGEFDFNKLKLNACNVCFMINGEQHSEGLFLTSVSYDGKKYKLELGDASGFDSEIVWQIIPKELRKKYDDVYHGGDIYFVIKNGKYGWTDKSGKEIVYPKYQSISDEFIEDAAIVWDNNGDIALVLKDGSEITPFKKYRGIYHFTGGLCPVMKRTDKERWGYVDKTGQEVIPVIYDYVEFEFKNGRAKVELNGETFFIDKVGNRIIESEEKVYRPLEGMRVLATGKFEHYSREEIRATIESKGGKYASAVTGTLDLLVCGKSVGKLKINKANELGIKMINEAEFNALISASDK